MADRPAGTPRRRDLPQLRTYATAGAHRPISEGERQRRLSSCARRLEALAQRLEHEQLTAAASQEPQAAVAESGGPNLDGKVDIRF